MMLMRMQCFFKYKRWRNKQEDEEGFEKKQREDELSSRLVVLMGKTRCVLLPSDALTSTVPSSPATDDEGGRERGKKEENGTIRNHLIVDVIHLILHVDLHDKRRHFLVLFLSLIVLWISCMERETHAHLSTRLS